MAAIVHIMRGIPGSGKSTLAKMLATSGKDLICSADHYFEDANGRYEFKAHLLAAAHAACLKHFIRSVHTYANKYAPLVHVVVDNTNLRCSEYEPYVKVAEIGGCEVKFEEFVPPRDNTLGDYVRLCASRNTHGVSPNQCMRMASVFESRG